MGPGPLQGMYYMPELALMANRLHLELDVRQQALVQQVMQRDGTLKLFTEMQAVANRLKFNTDCFIYLNNTATNCTPLQNICKFNTFVQKGELPSYFIIKYPNLLKY